MATTPVFVEEQQFIAPMSPQPQDHHARAANDHSLMGLLVDKDTVSKMTLSETIPRTIDVMTDITTTTTSEENEQQQQQPPPQEDVPAPEPLPEPCSMVAESISDGETTQMATCQICLEEFNEEQSGTHLVKNVCGEQQCESCVCRPCLLQHVDVTLGSCFLGLVPRVRCPICLGPFTMDLLQHFKSGGAELWQLAYDLEGLMDHLAERALGMIAPCCHSTEYSHLPEYETSDLVLAPLAPTEIESLREKLDLFGRHKLASHVVVNTLLHAVENVDTADEYELMDNILRNMKDSERRATLYLCFLNKRPDCWTMCCGMEFCFKCKRVDHHDECDLDMEIEHESCLVQCRKCRVMLVKVEGCDSVTCYCGFNMNWPDELIFRDLHERQLLPVDLLDIGMTTSWNFWRERFVPVRDLMEAAAQEMDRQRRLHALTECHHALLRRGFMPFVWRRRYRKAVRSGLRTFWVATQLAIPSISRPLTSFTQLCVKKRKVKKSVSWSIPAV